jgi:large conductance mechanosensitive channel
MAVDIAGLFFMPRLFSEQSISAIERLQEDLRSSNKKREIGIMLKDFRDFIARGNVVDLAVGVIIGGAFGAIVKSLVDQVIMPPIGLLTGGIDFAQLKIVLKAADETAKKPEVAILYGSLLNTVITFLIIAVVIFVLVRAVSALQRQRAAESAPPAGPTPTETLLTEIRDLLSARET